MDFSDNKEAIEAEAAEEATTMPGATMSVISVEDRDIGPETVQTERHLNSQQHLQLRQQPRSWITRLSGVGWVQSSGMSPSAVCWILGSTGQPSEGSS